MGNFLMGRLAGLQKFNNQTNCYCLLPFPYTRLDSYTPLFLQIPLLFKAFLPIPHFFCFFFFFFTLFSLSSSVHTSPPPIPPPLHVNQPYPASSLMDFSPPPSSSSSGSNSFPVIAIAVVGILATGLLLVGYYVFVIKCCLNWHRIDVLNRFSSRGRSNPTDNPSPNFTVQEGNDSTKGLDEAIIRAIPVIKFRKVLEKERENTNNNGPKRLSETASYECAVCLSEFEDGERLRVIPNCCHAFHIDCIDIWLQSNANCPLCRLWISPSSILHNDRIFLGSSTQENPTTSSDNFSGSDDDYVVIEIQGNNLDEPRLVKTRSEGGGERQKGRKLCSMGDEWIDMKREKDEEFRIVQPIRRSVSMDLSTDREFCLEIQQCSSITEMSEISPDSGKDCSSSSSSRVRRSIFSFGYGRNSRGSGSVQPVHLSPP